MSGTFRETTDIVLASGSPRRREMLAGLGIRFRVEPSLTEEPAPLPGEEPEDYALRMAAMKAAEVAARFPHSVVLAADTVVAIDHHVLGKPTDRADALRMLCLLAGRTHLVVTGCALNAPGQPPHLFAAHTNVTMLDPGPDVLAAYAASGEPDDKAGAYAIQGQGAFLVRHVEGSYTNVVGLPLARVVRLLRELGVVVPAGGRGDSGPEAAP